MADNKPSIAIDLRVAILIVGAVNVAAAGVGSLAETTGYHPELWMLALAFLINIVATYVLSQLDSWSRA